MVVFGKWRPWTDGKCPKVPINNVKMIRAKGSSAPPSPIWKMVVVLSQI